MADGRRWLAQATQSLTWRASAFGRGRVVSSTMMHEEAEGLSMTLAKLLQRSDRQREMRQTAPMLRSPSLPPYEPSPAQGRDDSPQVQRNWENFVAPPPRQRVKLCNALYALRAIEQDVP